MLAPSNEILDLFAITTRSPWKAASPPPLVLPPDLLRPRMLIDTDPIRRKVTSELARRELRAKREIPQSGRKNIAYRRWNEHT